MTLAQIIILLVTGAGVGFAGGMLGLGGAFIMTPVQYAVFTAMGLSTDIAIRLAFGTSLLVVLPTAISGAWRHHREGAVRWRLAFIMGGCSLAVAFGGATLSSHIPGAALKTAFGVIAILSGIRMLTAVQPREEQKPVNNPWRWVAWAIPVGAIVGILGVGGGIVLVPVLVLALRFEMHEAIANSLAVMIFSSIGGIIGYMINGVSASGLPPYSIGYVNLPVWLLLAVPSIAMAQLGAIASHRLSANWLRYIFIAIMFYMGLRMIGVFEWLGWPL